MDEVKQFFQKKANAIGFASSLIVLIQAKLKIENTTTLHKAAKRSRKYDNAA